jgi:hypothetical protein
MTTSKNSLKIIRQLTSSLRYYIRLKFWWFGLEKLLYLLDVVLHGDAAECDGENAGHVEYLSCDNPFVLDILRLLAL